MGLFGPPNINKLKGAKNVPALIQALRYTNKRSGEEENRIRREAEHALIGIVESSHTALLIDALQKRGVPKEPIIRALARTGNPDAAKKLVEMLGGFTWENHFSRFLKEIVAALDELHWQGQGKEWATYLMHKEDWPAMARQSYFPLPDLLYVIAIRYASLPNFLQRLGEARNFDSLPVLVACLDTEASFSGLATGRSHMWEERGREYQFPSKREEIAEASIQALAKIGQPAIDTLELALQQKKRSPFFYASAIRAFGQIGGDRALNVVCQTGVNPSASATAREAAIGELSTHKSETAEATCIQALADPADAVRLAALGALTAFKTIKPADRILDLLKESSLEIRLAALKYFSATSGSLQEANQPDQIIIDFLQDQDEKVRQSAIEYLRTAGREEFAVKIIPLLQDNQLSTRIAAIQALAGIPGNKALEQLTGSLKGSQIKIDATSSLAEIMQGEHDWEIRIAAAEALADRSESAATDSLLLALEAAHKEVLTLLEQRLVTNVLNSLSKQKSRRAIDR